MRKRVDDGAELDLDRGDAADGRAVQRARRPHAAADGNRAARAVGAIGTPTPDELCGTPSKDDRVFVTHDLEEAIALADEVVVLSAGPASRVVARHPVALRAPARPAGAADVAGVHRPVSRRSGPCCAKKSSRASASAVTAPCVARACSPSADCTRRGDPRRVAGARHAASCSIRSSSAARRDIAQRDRDVGGQQARCGGIWRRRSKNRCSV